MHGCPVAVAYLTGGFTVARSSVLANSKTSTWSAFVTPQVPPATQILELALSRQAQANHASIRLSPTFAGSFQCTKLCVLELVWQRESQRFRGENREIQRNRSVPALHGSGWTSKYRRQAFRLLAGMIKPPCSIHLPGLVGRPTFGCWQLKSDRERYHLSSAAMTASAQSCRMRSASKVAMHSMTHA